MIKKIISSIVFATSLHSALAYEYTLDNKGGAPIYSAHAVTQSGFCDDFDISLPPGGLQPGMSVTFHSQSICLVREVHTSVVGGGDMSSPYVVRASGLTQADIEHNKPIIAAMNKYIDEGSKKLPRCKTPQHNGWFTIVEYGCVDEYGLVKPPPGMFNTIAKPDILSPPIYPPYYDALAQATGTFVVGIRRGGESGICFHSGWADFWRTWAPEIVVAALSLAANQGDVGGISEGFIKFLSPELALALTLESVAWQVTAGFYNFYNPGIKTPDNPLSTSQFNVVRPEIFAEIKDNLSKNIQCGW